MDRIEKLCADRGMRMTEQRRVIARVLSNAEDHPDVEELYRRASAIDPHISIATVYRTVRLFEEAGVVEKHDFGDGRSRYEEAGDDHHDHLIDTKSGEVIEFFDAEIERLKSEIAERLGFQLIGHKLELYGVAIEGAEPSKREGLIFTRHADFVILNTCHIREKAAEKIYSELGKLREMRDIRRETGGDMTIAVAGCVAQAEGEEIMKRQPAVDIVVGPQAYHQLPELLTRTARARGERIGADFAPDDKFDALPAARFTEGPTAFLTVQEGCDKFCTFCVVPYTRGAEWSRPLASVLEEARQLADRGVREVTLLGQNVNAYDGERPDGKKATLTELAYALAEIPGLDRIRYTTSHPNDMSDDLIAAHGDLDALMPYLHLPVQAGSDRILRLMNRKHGRQKYLDLIDRIRAARPDIAMAGDFIVGFPGETDREFEDTLDLVRRVNYAGAFAFAYSPRPGTPAAGMGKQVEPEVAKERLHRLIALLTEQQTAFNEAQAGRTLNVLFDKPGRHGHRRQAIGRSPYLQSVHVDDADHLIGQIVPVEIVKGQQNSLSGRLISQQKAA